MRKFYRLTNNVWCQPNIETPFCPYGKFIPKYDNKDIKQDRRMDGSNPVGF